MAVIEHLKATAPPEPRKGQKRSKPEIAHLALIRALEDRIDAIDVELVVSNRFCREDVVIVTSYIFVFCRSRAFFLG
jgi:hypothetical protein